MTRLAARQDCGPENAPDVEAYGPDAATEPGDAPREDLRRAFIKGMRARRPAP